MDRAEEQFSNLYDCVWKMSKRTSEKDKKMNTKKESEQNGESSTIANTYLTGNLISKEKNEWRGIIWNNSDQEFIEINIWDLRLKWLWVVRKQENASA